MGLNITQKLIASQLIEGEPEAGNIVSIRINQTLAHDLTAPLVLSQFEQFDIDKILCDLAIFYIDHDVLPRTVEVFEQQQTIRAAAQRYGALFSRAGNGVCHHVHLERMATPGRTLLGAAGHTSSIGAIGMLSIAADAVEVASAMAGEPFQLVVPDVVRVVLHGKAKPFVSPKDIALELLRRRGIGGLAGKAIEFDGPSARVLGVYERATITNLSVSLGAVTTVFPSDEKTRIFLQRQRRSKSWRRIEADSDAEYAETESIDLGALEPLVLRSGPETAVKPVRELAGEPVQQISIGACSNASIRDLLALAGIMRGKKVNVDCVFTISPSSRQALEVLARGESSDSNGGLADLISAGVRILECGCGPCNRGHCVPKGTGIVQTYLDPRKFRDFDRVYVVSPETAAASAIQGQITDPRKLRRPPRIKLPRQLPVDDSMILKPNKAGFWAEVKASLTAPNLPEPVDLKLDLHAHVVGRLGHDAHLDELERSSSFLDQIADRHKTSCLIAGQNLTSTLSMPEVALTFRQKGLQIVIAEGFAPPTAITLAHAGVVPLRFVNKEDYEKVQKGDELVLPPLVGRLSQGEPFPVALHGNVSEIVVDCDLDERTISVLVSGGLLEFLKKNAGQAVQPA